MHACIGVKNTGPLGTNVKLDATTPMQNHIQEWQKQLEHAETRNGAPVLLWAAWSEARALHKCIVGAVLIGQQSFLKRIACPLPPLSLYASDS